MQDNYVFVSTDLKTLSIYDRSTMLQIDSKLAGVVDFCVSNANNLFVVLQTDTGQTLSTYTMNGNVFANLAGPESLGMRVQSITCMSGDYVFLNPEKGTNIM